MAEHTLDIESIDADGHGVARLGRRAIAVPLTIPGERVRVRVERTPGAPARDAVELLEVIRPSPHRVVPHCAHFGRAGLADPSCGGCSWQHIAYQEQLRLKTALVDRLVREAVPSAPPTLAMLPSTPWAFRHKVHFVFGRGGGGASLTMGHYARESRTIVPVVECPVHADAGNRTAFALRDAFVRAGVGAAIEQRGRGGRSALKSVAVRAARHTAEVMATIVVSGDTDPRLRSATRAALERHPGTALHVNVHSRDDGFIFGRETRRVKGPARLREQVAGVSFLISPTAFFQTNVAAAEILAGLVLDAVPRDTSATVLDLYAGAGLFALPLAARGHRVVAVETSRAAVADGEASRDFNAIPAGRCRFIAQTVERALERVAGADVVVMDPPREGCAPEVLRRVCEGIGPGRIIYVSCNPEALARDLRVMTGAGYRVASIQPVDMFPHTAHVEAVAVVSRPR